MKISKSELRELTQAASEAFWEVVAQRYPQARTGDLSIDLTCKLTVAEENAVEEWIDLNIPTA